VKNDYKIPFSNRTSCRYCGKKGYLKMIQNDNTNNDIVSYIYCEKYTFNPEPPRVECFCQNCGIISSYSVQSGLFSDGVIKEI